MSISDYVVPPIAAAFSIMPAFRDLMIKSGQQKGEKKPQVTYLDAFKEGRKVAPTVGTIIGIQVITQQWIQEKMFGKGADDIAANAVSSGIVGLISSPFIAIFNGRTMGFDRRTSLKRLDPAQTLAIITQETCFVGGMSVAGRVSSVMKRKFGDNKVVDYSSAYIAGAAGSLAGHPANTAFTRWQSGMKVENFRQLWWGAARRTHAIGIFATAYKFGKENLK
jgi:hypothetical protein